MKSKISLLLIFLMSSLLTIAQSYQLKLDGENTNPSLSEYWQVLEVDSQAMPKVLGKIPYFIDGIGYVHSPAIVEDQLFYGVVSRLNRPNGKQSTLFVFEAFQIEADSVRSIERYIVRLHHSQSKFSFVIDNGFACFSYQISGRLHSVVKLNLRTYEAGNIRDTFMYFARHCKARSSLERRFRSNYLNGI